MIPEEQAAFERDKQTIAAARAFEWRLEPSNTQSGMFRIVRYDEHDRDWTVCDRLGEAEAKAFLSCFTRWPIAIETALQVPALEADRDQWMKVARDANDHCVEEMKKREQLESQVAALQTRIAELEAENTALEQGGTAMSAELSSMADEAESRERSIERVKEREQAAVYELTAERARATGLAEEIERHLTYIRQLEGIERELRGKASNLTQDNDRLRSELTAACGVVARCHPEILARRMRDPTPDDGLLHDMAVVLTTNPNLRPEDAAGFRAALAPQPQGPNT